MKPTKAKKANRRTFIKGATLAAAGFTIVPRHVLGGAGFIAPSDTLNIAGIGAGGKGASDIKSFSESKSVNIVSLCDVDDRQSGETRKNFPKASYYKDFRELLEKEEKNIDAVSVSTPDHTHAVAAYAAMQMGKHVYVQKPLTHDIYEARILTEAAIKYKVVTQMGNQGGSGDGVRKMKEMYDAGMIGEVKRVKCWTNRAIWPQALATPTEKMDIPTELDWDLWLSTAPSRDFHDAYVPWNWRGWTDYGTGALGDMACHIMDPVYRILPILYPNEVECSVSGSYRDKFAELEYPDSFPNSSKIHFNYPRTDGKGDIKVAWMDGGILPERPDGLLPDEEMGNWDGGVIFEGTDGILMGDCYGANPRLVPTARMTEEEMPAETVQRVPEGHYIQWVNACMAGYENGKTSSSFDFAGPFTESILLGNLALKSFFIKNPDMKDDNFWGGKRYIGRKKLLWDAENMKVTNFDEANQFVKRTYREGYSIGS